MPRLERTAFALEKIKEHLEKIEHRNTEIENFLVRHLAVVFYSEMERNVKKIYSNRLHFDGDARLKHFIERTHDNMLRRIKKSDIKKLAECFGEECKQKFDAQLNEKDVSFYNSAINHRHGVAHDDGEGITLPTMESAIDAAERILDILEEAIK